MSKTIHVRDILDDVYYGLKQYQMRLHKTKWIDFYERLIKVLNRADAQLPGGIAEVVRKIEKEELGRR